MNISRQNDTLSDDKELPLELVILTYVIIVLGFTANGFICAAFLFNRKIRVVNNYFVLNLAISDLLLIVSLCLVMALPKLSEVLPVEHHRKMRMGMIIFETFCGSASIANITVISYDRYYAVTKPLHYSAHMTHRKAICLIVCIWYYAAVVGILQLIRLAPDPNYFKFGYMPFLAICNGLIPLAITLYCYTTIFLIASNHLRHNPHKNHDASSAASLLSKNLKIAFNIIVLVAPLLVFWNIYYIISVVEVYCERCGHSSCCIPLTIFTNWIISDMAHILATIDPIVYICLTKDFRKIIFGWFKCRNQPYPVSETFHLSSTTGFSANNNHNSPSDRRMVEIPG